MKRFLRTMIVLAITCLTGGWTTLPLGQVSIQPVHRPVQPIHRPKPVHRPVHRHTSYSYSVNDSSDSDSDENKNEDAGTVHKIEWAETGTLLLPPKVLAVGNTLVFPDAKYGKIIHFTNTELTLLIKEEEIKYPFKLKN